MGTARLVHIIQSQCILVQLMLTPDNTHDVPAKKGVFEAAYAGGLQLSRAVINPTPWHCCMRTSISSTERAAGVSLNPQTLSLVRKPAQASSSQRQKPQLPFVLSQAK